MKPDDTIAWFLSVTDSIGRRQMHGGEHPDAAHLAVIPFPIMFAATDIPLSAAPFMVPYLMDRIQRTDWDDELDWSPDGTITPTIDAHHEDGILIIMSLRTWLDVFGDPEMMEWRHEHSRYAPRVGLGSLMYERIAKYVRGEVARFVQSLRETPGVLTQPDL